MKIVRWQQFCGETVNWPTLPIELGRCVIIIDAIDYVNALIWEKKCVGASQTAHKKLKIVRSAR